MSVLVFFPGMLLHCQGCFHCSKYCFPDFSTGGGKKNPTHFAMLHSDVNYFENSRCSQLTYLLL